MVRFAAPRRDATSTDAARARRLPKACRTPEARKEVARAVINALVSVKSADISADKVVVRFSEAVDGFALPPGHTRESVDAK